MQCWSVCGPGESQASPQRPHGSRATSGGREGGTEGGREGGMEKGRGRKGGKEVKER